MEDIIKTYIEYLDKIEKDPSYEATTNENDLLYNINNNPKYTDIIKAINNAPSSNRIGILQNYLFEEETKKLTNEELVSKIYGINVTNIENFKLNNDVDIFTFYDERLGRKRIIKNLGRESLISQLKNSQELNVDYQTNDYEKNANNILVDRALENSNRQELNMIDINDYIAHPEDYGTLTNDTALIINKIYNEKDNKKIKYINLDNMVLLTENNDVIEMTKDENDNIILSTPSKWKSNISEVSNEDKVKEQYYDDEISSDEIDTTIESNNFEDEPEFISAEDIESELSVQNLNLTNINEVNNNIIHYYNNPEKIEDIEDPIEKAFYEKMVNEIYAVRKSEYEKKKQRTMSMTLSNNDYGFVNIILISILSIFLVFMIYTTIKMY